MYRDRSRPTAMPNNYNGGSSGYTPSSFNSYQNKNNSGGGGGYVPSSYNTVDSSSSRDGNNDNGYVSSAYNGHRTSDDNNGSGGYNPSNNNHNSSSSSSSSSSNGSNHIENSDSVTVAEKSAITTANNTYKSLKEEHVHAHEINSSDNDNKSSYKSNKMVDSLGNGSPVKASSSSSTSYTAYNRNSSTNDDTTPDRGHGSNKYHPATATANNDAGIGSMKPMDEENIDVVIRVRPLRSYEKEKGETPCVKIRDRVGTAGGAPISQEVQVSLGPLEAQVFSCKKCFNSNTSQEDVFTQSGITSLLDSSVEGYRACAFAFGQTGAGKTYTVIGPSNSISPGSESDGLLGRSIGYMYDKVEATRSPFTITISCLEIYAEHVYDLLVDERYRISLPVRENPAEGFFLEGSKAVQCTTRKAAFKVIDGAMKNRHIGEHDMNSRSSRSHCLTEINISIPTTNTSTEDGNNVIGDDDDDNVGKKRNYVVLGRMSLVDLAGSERLKSTKSTGKVLQEAGFINKSLYVLGKVIAGLVRTHGDRNHRDVPYRDSKLTKLLISSLGGAGRTMLMACISEASGSQIETLRTLKFSMSAARIKNKPVRFLSSHDKLVENLRDEIRRLRNENMQLRTSLSTAPSMMGMVRGGVGMDTDDDISVGNRHNHHFHDNRYPQGGLNRVYSLQDTRGVGVDGYGQRVGLRQSKSMKAIGGNGNSNKKNRGAAARKFLHNDKMDAMSENDEGDDHDGNMYAQDTSNLFANVHEDDDERIMNAERRNGYDDVSGSNYDDDDDDDDEYSLASVPPPRIFGNKDIFKPVLRKKLKNNKKGNKYGGSPFKLKKAHPFLSQKKREEARMLEKISPNKYQPSAVPSHQSAESEKIRLLEERLERIERESSVIKERRAKEHVRKMTRRRPVPSSNDGKDMYSQGGKVSPFISHVATHGKQLAQKKLHNRGKSYMLPKIVGDVEEDPVEILDPKEKARRRAEQIRKDRQRGLPVQKQRGKNGSKMGGEKALSGVERTSVRPQKPEELYQIKKKARARALANSGHYNHNHNYADEDEDDHVEVQHANVHRQVEVLESQLREQRRQMEDNPGAVTTEDEERAVALEKEVRAMKVETAYLKDTSSKQKQKSSSVARDIHSGGASHSKDRVRNIRKDKIVDDTKKALLQDKGSTYDSPSLKTVSSKASLPPSRVVVTKEVDNVDNDGVPTPRGVKDAEKAVELTQSSSPSPSTLMLKSSPKHQKVKQSPSFQKGDKVEGNYNGEGEWYLGTVVESYDEGEDGYTYDINYDDGDKETKVYERLMRKSQLNDNPLDTNVDSSHVSPTLSVPEPASIPAPTYKVIPPAVSSPFTQESEDVTSRPSIEFKKGDRIEAQFDGHVGGTEYFSGVITAVKGSDIYDIDYDDGDKESDVKAKYIRKSTLVAVAIEAPASTDIDTSTTTVSSSPHAKKHHHHHHGNHSAGGDSDDEYGDDDFDDDFEDE